MPPPPNIFGLVSSIKLLTSQTAKNFAIARTCWQLFSTIFPLIFGFPLLICTKSKLS